MKNRSILIATLGIPMHAVSGAVHKVLHVRVPFIARHVHRHYVEMTIGAMVMSFGVVVSKASVHGEIAHLACDVAILSTASALFRSRRLRNGM